MERAEARRRKDWRSGKTGAEEIHDTSRMIAPGDGQGSRPAEESPWEPSGKWRDPTAGKTPARERPELSTPPLDGESGRPTIQLPHGTLEEEQLNKLDSDEGTLQYVDDCERWMIRYAGSMLIETYGNTKGGTSQRPYLLDHRGIWKRDDGHALYESFQATARGYAAATRGQTT